MPAAALLARGPLGPSQGPRVCACGPPTIRSHYAGAFSLQVYRFCNFQNLESIVLSKEYLTMEFGRIRKSVFIDDIGTPDPNPRNSVNWCL